jgi:hypothetical protein
VLAYSRAPGGPGGTGVSVAPHWSGPYTRMTQPFKDVAKSPFKGGKNYSVAGARAIRLFLLFPDLFAPLRI